MQFPIPLFITIYREFRLPRISFCKIVEYESQVAIYYSFQYDISRLCRMAFNSLTTIVLPLIVVQLPTTLFVFKCLYIQHCKLTFLFIRLIFLQMSSYERQFLKPWPWGNKYRLTSISVKHSANQIANVSTKWGRCST